MDDSKIACICGYEISPGHMSKHKTGQFHKVEAGKIEAFKKGMVYVGGLQRRHRLKENKIPYKIFPWRYRPARYGRYPSYTSHAIFVHNKTLEKHGFNKFLIVGKCVGQNPVDLWFESLRK